MTMLLGLRFPALFDPFPLRPPEGCRKQVRGYGSCNLFSSMLLVIKTASTSTMVASYKLEQQRLTPIAVTLKPSARASKSR